MLNRKTNTNDRLVKGYANDKGNLVRATDQAALARNAEINAVIIQKSK